MPMFRLKNEKREQDWVKVKLWSKAKVLKNKHV